jgi:hypothetical protein
MARIPPFGTQPFTGRIPDLYFGGYLDERPLRLWVKRHGLIEGVRLWRRARR